jgi:hypothetical protein
MKVVFITGHAYKTKKEGGFHRFAKYLSDKGLEVVFFTYPTPIHVILRNRSPKTSILFWDKDKSLINVQRINWALPQIFYNYINSKSIEYFHLFPKRVFNKFVIKYFNESKVFVFESNASVVIFNYLKQIFPEALYVYRPSDPMAINPKQKYLKKFEINILNKANYVFPVNNEGLALYKKVYKDQVNFETNKFRIISNGVELKNYNSGYKPSKNNLNRKKLSAVYVGVWPVDWDLIFYTAERLPFVDFIIIIPKKQQPRIMRNIKTTKNITFIQGVFPNEVPFYVNNSSIIIVPYKKDDYKNYSRGITAKYYQAMVANKPIVSYHDDPSLKNYGITVVFDKDDFVKEVKKQIGKNKLYNINVSELNWEYVCEQFYQNIINWVST